MSELEVLDTLKGTLGASTVYLPVPFTHRGDGEPLQTGDTGFLFAPPDADYQAPRRFWTEVDALRQEAPLVEGADVMWVPVIDQKVALAADLVLALGAEPEPANVPDHSIGLYLVPTRSFVLARDDALAKESPLPKP